MTITASEREALEIVKRVTSRYAPNQMVIENFRCDVLRSLLALAERASGEPKQWMVFCPVCNKHWAVDYPHPGKEVCAVHLSTNAPVQFKMADDDFKVVLALTERATKPSEREALIARLRDPHKYEVQDVEALCHEAADALAERAAGEPVAWVHPCGEFVLVDPEDEDTHDFSNTGDGKWRALVYAAPDAGENPSKK